VEHVRSFENIKEILKKLDKDHISNYPIKNNQNKDYVSPISIQRTPHEKDLL
jgi:hypothetical protein